MLRSSLLRLGALALCTLVLLAPARAQDYYVYVTAESEDEVALVRFDAATETAEVAKRIAVGVWPTEIEGPHGIAVAPDGKHWYLSMAHGQPYGSVYKYETETDMPVADVEVGLFPATMAVSEATGLLYVVNFNLHGDMVPSSVSVVDPETMTEITKVETGPMPHGSRLAPDGRHHYSAAMMSGELFEIDALTLEVTRRLDLAPGAGHADMQHDAMDHDAMDHDAMQGPMPKPTWVHPHPTEPLAYVALNGIAQIAEVNLEDWTVTRRFETGKGPYNLEVSPDGRLLVVSYKSEGTTAIWDLEAGEELAVLPNTRRVTHGVAISPDSRYAFVSVEGVGGEPGSVDVIDLQRRERVAHAEVGKQAGGIAFWKVEPDTQGP